MKNGYRSTLGARLPSAGLLRLCLILTVLAAATGLLPPPGPAAAPAAADPALAASDTSTLYLPAVFGPAPAKSSFELIDDALRAGELDEETALIYQVYAITLDPRLPAIYRGADKDDLEHNALREAVRRWDSLSAGAQALLAPFLVPPLYEGSWVDPAGASSVAGAQASGAVADATCRGPVPLPGLLPGWQRLTTAHATVWYQTAGDIAPGDWQMTTPEQAAATAQAAASVIEHIIQQETGLMEQWPIFDTNEPCNGGDGSIDIYITRRLISTGAQAVPYPPGEVLRPGYIWLAPDYADGDLKKVRNALAHEFFHLISLSYPQARAESDLGLPEYAWLDEATANWMVDYVYKDDQFEHQAAADYLRPAYRQPDHWAPLEMAFERGVNGYEDYVYLQFLDIRLGPQVMRAIWEATPNFDSLAAINEATKGAGGFERLWPEFALVAWNDWQNGFLDDLYRWDRLEPGMSQETFYPGPQQVALGGKRWDKQVTFYWVGGISHVSIGMSRHVFGDPSVRSVLFSNKLVGVRGAHMWALLKIGGEWTVEDWTNKRQTQFCRQVPSERLEELVIIITNSVFDDRAYSIRAPEGGSRPTLTFTNLACGEWQGTVTAVHRDDTTGRHDLETIHTTATFEPNREFSEPGDEFALFQLKQGTMHWEYTGTMGDCQIQADTVDVTLQPATDDSLSIRQWRADMSLIGQFGGVGTSSYEPTLTFVCPEESWDQPWQTMPWLLTGPMGTSNARISPDGTTIAGRYEWGTPGDGRSWTIEWNFVAVSP
jgi:hypothetical protein